MRIKNVMWALALGIFITACENDDNNGGEPMPEGDYTDGILVTNEGPFNNGTGTISYISSDLETKEDNIFNTVNNEDLGNIVQSIGFVGNTAYVIANVSNKINVVDRYSFEKEGTIDTGFSSPRYFVEANGTGFVSNWGENGDVTDDYIAVVNLTTNEVDGSIPVTVGPEKMVVSGNTIYVANKGVLGTNNLITVINAQTLEIETTITVGDRPDSMQLDDDGNLWVLSSGQEFPLDAQTAGQLDKIDVSTNEVVSTFEFSGIEHPKYLNVDGDNLYYNLEKDIFSITTSATTLPTSSLLTHTTTAIYGMNSNDGRLFITDALDYASNGILFIYDLSTKEKVKEIIVGRNPNGTFFN